MLRVRGNRLSTGTRPLDPRPAAAYGARGTRKMLVPPQRVGPAAAASAPTTLSLERLAAMRVALVGAESSSGVVSAADRGRILAPYGLDAASEKAESAAWTARFKTDRFLFADYMQLFTRLRAAAADDDDGATGRRLSAAREAERGRQKDRGLPYSD